MRKPTDLLTLSFAFVAGLVVLSNIPSCGADDYSELHQNSGIRGPSHQEILKSLQNLETSYPGMAKVLSYGTTAGGRELKMIRIGKASASGPRPAVLISGSTHGDEYLNIEDRLPGWFLQNQSSPGVQKFLAKNGLIYIVPIFNPDGYEAQTRENLNGTDLNRDYDSKAQNLKNFRNPETRGLTDLLKKEVAENSVKLKLTLDYHCCFGAIIYPWAAKHAPLPEPDRAAHADLAELLSNPFSYRTGQIPEITGYSVSGSSADYYYETFNSRSFAFEGEAESEAKNFSKHVKMWDEVLGRLADE